MREHDEVEREFRAATREVRPAPLRWERIDKRRRRRRRAGLGGLILIGVAITVVLAGGFLAGKTAVDSDFQPPLISDVDISVQFADPRRDQGHVPLAEVLPRGRPPATRPAPSHLRREGFLFEATVDISGYEGETLLARWAVVNARTRAAVPIKTFADTSTFTPSSGETTRRFQMWAPYPKRSGTYAATLRVEDANGNVVEEAADRFVVLRPDYFRMYSASSYKAKLPRRWRITDDDERRRSSRVRRVTRVTGPSGMSVVIDTTRNTKGDPARSASILEPPFRSKKSYRRVEFRRDRLDGTRAFEWSYAVGARATTRFFLYRRGDGFAVQSEGPLRRFEQVRTLAREVASSIRPRG